MRLLQKIIALCLGGVLMWGSVACAEELTILYYERPPYYFSVGSRPGGFLMHRVRTIMRELGVQARYRSVPPKRILTELRSFRPVCSVGWFHKVERQLYAQFSLPLFQNEPLIVFFRLDQSERFKDHQTLRNLFEDESLTWGVVDGFSYGDSVDTLRRDIGPPTVVVTGTQRHLVCMLAQGRFDYMLVPPEEVDTMLKVADLSRKDFASISLSGMPEGNKRHIMCSQNVPQDFLERVNDVIRRRFPLQ